MRCLHARVAEVVAQTACSDKTLCSKRTKLRRSCRADHDRPDIVHTHDWATAPVAFGAPDGCASVFTIHNLNYGADLIGRAMGAAAACTTVSPTYAAEVRPPPCSRTIPAWAAQALRVFDGPERGAKTTLCNAARMVASQLQCCCTACACWAPVPASQGCCRARSVCSGGEACGVVNLTCDLS